MFKESEPEQRPRIKLEDVRYVVFEGGSVKGISYVGAWTEAVSRGLKFDKLKGLAGTSAGAINAMLLALGYSPTEMENWMGELDFKTLVGGDSSSTIDVLISLKNTKSSFSLFTEASSHSKELSNGSILLKNSFGLFDGEICRKWLENRIRDKAKDESGNSIKFLTFGELHRLVEKNPGKYCDLYVVGNCVNSNISKIFSWETTPDVIISDAVRISMSIPVIFKPHQIYVKEQNHRKLDKVSENLLFIDGGVTDNLPYFIFDKSQYWPDKDKLPPFSGGTYTNPTTLGFSLVNKENRDYLIGKTKEPPKQQIESFLTYLSVVLKSIYKKQKSDHIHACEQWRTVYIDTCGINTLDFDLNEDDKKNLIGSGHESVKDFLRGYARVCK